MNNNTFQDGDYLLDKKTGEVFEYNQEDDAVDVASEPERYKFATAIETDGGDE